MSKRKKGRMHIMTVTGKRQFELAKPRYNGHAIGHGIHGDTSYNRLKTKRETKRLLNEEPYFLAASLRSAR